MVTKICYTIGEVAQMFSQTTSTIRFWSDNFDEFIHPRRNAKGNRLFSPEDIEAFKKINYYLKEKGMTIAGAQKLMHDNSDGADRRVEVIEKLKDIRARLVEIRDSI